METALAFVCGVIVAASLYLMLSGNLIRFIFGLVLATNSVNLLIFLSGRLQHTQPPQIAEDATIPGRALANALPQALILTAIVIGFALSIFVFILFYKAYQSLGTVDTESMRAAEPREEGREPIKDSGAAAKKPAQGEEAE